MSQVTRVTLADLLSTRFSPIQETLLPLFHQADIIALMKTSKDIHANVHYELKAKAFDINVKLRNFFKDPHAFRSVQAKCDALIPGDFARKFFDRTPFRALVIYVDKDADGMKAYLEADGYTIVKSVVEDDPADDLTGTTYRKRTHGSLFKVVVVYSKTHPARIMVLQGARTTGDLNFISWNKAYSLVPFTTWVRKETYLLGPVSKDHSRPMKDYEEHGIRWKSIHWNAYDRNPPKDCKLITQLRRIGDHHTWTINLDTDGVTPSTTPENVLESSTFKVTLPPVPARPTAHYKISVCCIDSPVLRHRYVRYCNEAGAHGPSFLEYDEKITTLSNRLHEMTVFELLKLDKDQRPAGVTQILDATLIASTLRRVFELPAATGIFCDDEVVEYLNRAWKEQVKMYEAE
ncbi:hypothetical protein EJ02DRAFT_55469 [Clathrospora elynae]|uniref:Uncharacterized protein n=1 Tax=Clathrospora elynae TaxID=706981 RepID=A0A6A5SA52_9PLEO|nr:hypothetical protein EJ02DRAFT_55469 [Clathrospora elynae]